MTPRSRVFRLRGAALCAAALALLPAAHALAAPMVEDAAPAPKPAVRRAEAALSGLRGFVANEGQWHEQVRFFARSAGMELTLLDDALVIVPARPLGSEEPRPEPLVLRLPAAAAHGLHGVDPLDTQHHFLGGARSASHVPAFDSVRFRGAAPGLDLVVRREATGFAYDLHLEAGAVLADFELTLKGSHGARLRSDGVLVIDTPSGPLEQSIGAAWQTDPASGERIDVASRFELRGSGEAGATALGFAAPDRDVSRPFVLDPSLVYTTYVGGVGQELLWDMDVGPDGSSYLYATVQSFAGTPTVPGAVQPESTGSVDVWVGRLSPTGSRLIWGTFLGGLATEDAGGVHLDTDGTVVLTGRSWSEDFPSTPDVVQPATGSPGKSDLFITRITHDGSALVWSTYYGGPELDLYFSSALAPNGDVLVSGKIGTPEPPPTPGAFDTQWIPEIGTLLRLSSDGQDVEFQTYFSAGINAITFHEGDLYLTGGAGQVFDLQATPGAFQATHAGGSGGDGFVARMDPTGSQLRWLTFMGGTKSEVFRAIHVDAAGAIYLTGSTSSDDFPTTQDSFDPVGSVGSQGFVAKMLPNGTGLIWSTFISACCGGVDTMWDLAVDSAGNAIAVGSTNQPNFPVTPDAFQPVFLGPSPQGDTHFTKFGAIGSELVYSTYLGGSAGDSETYIGLDASEQPRIAFQTGSPDLPVTPKPFDGTYAGGTDIGAAAFELPVLPWTVLGFGKQGALDVPNLAGGGTLTPGAPTRLAVRGAAPNAQAWFLVGLQAIHVPFKGGTLVPEPLLFTPFVTSATGAHDRAFPWLDVPAGIELHIQTWIQDPGAFLGWSATNALRLVSQ